MDDVTPRARARRVIVNADDFGQSRGIVRGVIEAHESGVVTSASLMVRWPAAVQAAEYARSRPSLSVGIHFDLGEWRYADGEWTPIYTVANPADPTSVERELRWQLARFRELMGRDPSHLDSHQHVHREEPRRAIVEALGTQLKVPVRDFGEVVYAGGFYGQSGLGEPLPHLITVDALIGILDGVRPGVTEIGCHPGRDADVDSPYRTERAKELAALCDPRVAEFVRAADIELCSYHDLDPADIGPVAIPAPRRDRLG
jgi:predicted glycoside hydrolase/deacetylase ChbG (UPF0249 family)